MKKKNRITLRKKVFCKEDKGGWKEEEDEFVLLVKYLKIKEENV